MTFKKRKSDQSLPPNPYAAPNVSSSSSNEDADAKPSSIHLEQAGCFFVMMLLGASMALFLASLFYNPFAPPATVYQDNGIMFSIMFVFVSGSLIFLGAIVFYNELRKNSAARR